MRYSDKLLEWLYPSKCPICDKILPHGTGSIICPLCRNDLYTLRINTSVRDINYDNGFYFESVISAFMYKDPLRQTIHHIKYNKKSYKAVSMSALMVEALTEAINKHRDFDLIIPVPLHKNRLRQRGFNQATILAKKIEEAIGIYIDESICIRRVDSMKQSFLNAQERVENTHEIFSLRKRADLSNKKIILVDDIFTTGSTLNSLAKLLKENGAKTISCITLCLSEVET